MSSVETAERALRDRLDEIQDEERRLQQALRVLGGEIKATKPRSRRARSRASTGGRRRARRGHRKAQFLREVKANPGMPVSEIAARLKIAPSQAYTLARRLTEAGEIKKRGKGYAIRA